MIIRQKGSWDYEGTADWELTGNHDTGAKWGPQIVKLYGTMRLKEAIKNMKLKAKHPVP